MKKLLLFKHAFFYALIFAQIFAIAQPQYGGGVNSFISTANSSTSTLTSGSVFTGTSEDVSQYAEIRISVISNVASATDGLSLQQSSDGTNWDITDVFTVPAATGKIYSIGVASKFFRIVYTNGGTNQASFRLLSVYHKVRTKASSQRPQDARPNDNDFEESLAYNMVYDPVTNVWNRMQVQDLPIIGQSAQTATVNNILSTTSGTTPTDALGYRSFSVQVVSTGSGGTYIFEHSNDGTNFQSLTVYSTTSQPGTLIAAAITATSSSLIYHGTLTTRYIRLRIVSTITGGSIQAFTKLSQESWTPSVFHVVQPTAANLGVVANIASAQTLATVTTVSTVTTLANGQTAHSSASTGSPVRAAGRVVPTTAATQDQTLVAGDAANLPMTTSDQLIIKPYATSETDWHYAAATSGIVSTTTAVTFKAASGTAGIKNYITAIEIGAIGAGTATELCIRDGAAGTVIWRIQVPAAGFTFPLNVNFTTPLKGTANTLLEVVTLTSSATPIYFNAHGYTGF